MSRTYYYKKAINLGYNGAIKWPRGTERFWKNTYKKLRLKEKNDKRESLIQREITRIQKELDLEKDNVVFQNMYTKNKIEKYVKQIERENKIISIKYDVPMMSSLIGDFGEDTDTFDWDGYMLQQRILGKRTQYKHAKASGNGNRLYDIASRIVASKKIAAKKERLRLDRIRINENIRRSFERSAKIKHEDIMYDLSDEIKHGILRRERLEQRKKFNNRVKKILKDKKITRKEAIKQAMEDMAVDNFYDGKQPESFGTENIKPSGVADVDNDFNDALDRQTEARLIAENNNLVIPEGHGDSHIINGPIEADYTIRQYIQDNNIYGPLKIQFMNGDKSIRTRYYNIPQGRTATRKYWENNSRFDWSYDSYGNIFAEYPGGSILINEVMQLGTPTMQSFSDDVNKHCLLGPIKEWIDLKLTGKGGKRQKQMYKKKQKDMLKFMELYEDGVPEDKIQSICECLKISIYITDVFSKVKEYKLDRANIRNFKFQNVRFDHVDMLTSDCIKMIVDQEEMDRLSKIDQYFTYRESYTGITKINTATHEYTLQYNKDLKKFDKYINEIFPKMGESDAAKFCRLGIHVSGVHDYTKTKNMVGKMMGEIDHSKSYTKFKECEFYQGFPVITDFRICTDIKFMKENVGIYEILLSNLPEKLKPLYDNIGYGNSNSDKRECVLTSPEINFLMSHGCNVEVLRGAWGIQKEFEFPQYMYEKINGTALYSIWSGIQGMYNGVHTINCNVDKKMAEYLQYVYKDGILCYKDSDNENKIHCKYNIKNKIYHRNHIFAFICSYSRIQTLQQLMTIPIDNLVRVCGDGIYVHDTKNVKLMKSFIIKDKKFPTNGASLCFLSSSFIQTINIKDMAPFRPNNMIELHKGAGGCGKTHSQLTDHGFVNPTFVTISWKLTSAKINEYKCDGTVLARVLGQQCQKARTGNVLIIDEVSMLNQHDFDMLKKLNKKLILCGDIDYQLGCVHGTPANFDNIPTINHTKNYRSTDKKHLENLELLRKGVDTNTFHYLYEQVDEQYVIDNYKIDDYIICSLNNCRCLRHKCKRNLEKQKYLEKIQKDKIKRFKKGLPKKSYRAFKTKLICNCNKICVCESASTSPCWTRKIDQSGAKKKWLITKNAKYNNGDILIQEEKPSYSKLRHAFTIHSLQGTTCEKTLFIDCRNLFNQRMLYTACSRVRRYDQIKLVNVPKPQCNMEESLMDMIGSF